MKEIIFSEFNSDVVTSEVPVIVDFFAPWCNPCKLLAPTLEALEAQYEGKIKVVKVDIDAEENYELVTSLGVRSVPTLKFFKGGLSHESIVGLAPKSKIIEAIEGLING